MLAGARSTCLEMQLSLMVFYERFRVRHVYTVESVFEARVFIVYSTTCNKHDGTRKFLWTSIFKCFSFSVTTHKTFPMKF